MSQNFQLLGRRVAVGEVGNSSELSPKLTDFYTQVLEFFMKGIRRIRAQHTVSATNLVGMFCHYRRIYEAQRRISQVIAVKESPSPLGIRNNTLVVLADDSIVDAENCYFSFSETASARDLIASATLSREEATS